MLSPEPQNTDITTGPVVVWVETIPLCQGLVFATGHQRPWKHAWWDGMSFTNEVAGTQFWAESQWSEPVSALIATSKVCRACFLSTWNVFSFTQVAHGVRGTDCQTRWSVSVGSLLIITMASTLNGRINPTSQNCKNVHLFGLGTDVDRPRRCAAAWKLKSRTHSRDNLTSNPSLRAHCRRSLGTTSGAVGTSTRADACALQAYTQLPAPPNHHLNSGISMSNSSINFWRFFWTSSRTLVFLVHGAWHFGIVVNRRTQSIRCIVTSKTIFAHATATGTKQQSRPQVHWNSNHTWTDSVWSSSIP